MDKDESNFGCPDMCAKLDIQPQYQHRDQVLVQHKRRLCLEDWHRLDNQDQALLNILFSLKKDFSKKIFHLELNLEAMQADQMNLYESDHCYWAVAWKSLLQLPPKAEVLEVS